MDGTDDLGGRDLAAAYAAEVVGPLLDSAAPRMPIALARLGSGSDVLGLDDVLSRDHDWGLRLTALVPEGEVARVDALLEERLPDAFRGHPARFAVTWDPRVRQRIEVATATGFALSRTGADASRPLDTEDWLSLTGQGVLEVTAGPVFRDDDGVLAAVRERLGRYPDDIRRYALASGWRRIEQELPFLGRTAARGDDAGSRVIGGRLVDAAMQLGFLLERRWAPYPKWRGTVFRGLPRVGGVAVALETALTAASAVDREAALVEAIEGLAAVQAADGLPGFQPVTEPFYDRPFRGLRPVAEAVRRSIADPIIRALPLIGTPEQWAVSVDLLMDHDLRRRMTAQLLTAR